MPDIDAVETTSIRANGHLRHGRYSRRGHPGNAGAGCQRGIAGTELPGTAPIGTCLPGLLWSQAPSGRISAKRPWGKSAGRRLLNAGNRPAGGPDQMARGQMAQMQAAQVQAAYWPSARVRLEVFPRPSDPAPGFPVSETGFRGLLSEEELSPRSPGQPTSREPFFFGDWPSGPAGREKVFFLLGPVVWSSLSRIP